jgi:hypothetical protein
MKTSNDKKTISYTLPLSALLHGGLLLLVGGAVIVRQNIPSTAPVGILEEQAYPADVVEEAEPMEQELQETSSLEIPTDQPEMAASSESSLAMDLIASEAPTASNAFLVMPGSASGTNLVGGTGAGVKGGTGTGRAGVKAATIFGRKVEANKIGVVFDISFSTHELVDKALLEIERGFPDAVVVLAPGCGISGKAKGDVMVGSKYLGDIKKFQYNKAKYYMGAFLPALLEKNKNFEKMWKKGLEEKRMYVIHLERPDAKANAMLDGTHFAFDFLRKEGVDTIWWMADFKDPIVQSTAESEARKLTQAGIKVIQHDFDGGGETKEVSKKVLAEQTGGEIVLGFK